MNYIISVSCPASAFGKKLLGGEGSRNKTNIPLNKTRWVTIKQTVRTGSYPLLSYQKLIKNFILITMGVCHLYFLFGHQNVF